jgi:cytochrome b6-f complex iron-sulfur subunit
LAEYETSGSPGEELTRRQLLGIGAVAGVGLAAGCVPLIGYVSPIAASMGERRAEIPADTLELWTPQRVLVRGSPGFVLKTPDEIYACSGVCPHLGCIVKWNRSQRVYFCPCHGARFAPDGRVLGGPAPGPLPRHGVEKVRGKLVVEPA